jgi:hypothetical protein
MGTKTTVTAKGIEYMFISEKLRISIFFVSHTSMSSGLMVSAMHSSQSGRIFAGPLRIFRLSQ